MKNFKQMKMMAGRAASTFLFVAAALTGQEAKAQLIPLGAGYIQNQYIINPAMAGVEKGFVVDIAARKQWAGMPGSPITQSLTAVYGSGKRVGLGFNLYNDKAGLIKNTRMMATYAYHLPLSDKGQHLSFGLSLGFMDERIANEDINGDQGDMSVSRFQDRETFIDGDFGAAYVGKRFNVQLAVPNLKGFFRTETVQGADLANRYLFFGALGYKFRFPYQLNGLGVEPKLFYRNIKGTDDIIDLGTNITLMDDMFNVLMLYHTSGNLTVGLGAKALPAVQIGGLYTSGTAALQGASNGNFELNLKVDISKL